MRSMVGLVLLLAGCFGGGGSKSVTFVQEATPNPFREPGCRVSVGEVTYDASITASDEDKKAFSFALKQELVVARAGLILDGPPSGANTFLLRPSLVSFTSGRPSQLQVDVSDAAGGAVLDQIRVTAKANSLRDASSPFGKPLSRYLKSRFCSR